MLRSRGAGADRNQPPSLLGRANRPTTPAPRHHAEGPQHRARREAADREVLPSSHRIARHQRLRSPALAAGPSASTLLDECTAAVKPLDARALEETLKRAAAANSACMDCYQAWWGRWRNPSTTGGATAPSLPRMSISRARSSGSSSDTPSVKIASKPLNLSSMGLFSGLRAAV